MFKLIAVIDKSHIIREGIAALLRNHGICQRIGLLESLEEWKLAFKDNHPDIIMINPEFLQNRDTQKIKAKLGIAEKTPFVGIIYQYCERNILNAFDETIYITDSEDMMVSKLHNMSRQHEEPAKSESLTAREKDVLRLLLQGMSNKEVADRLVISTHTVIAHRKNIIDKTGIRSLSGLAVYALLNNIADMEQLSK